MDWERIRPQVVRHRTGGWTVQIADRYHVQYIEGDFIATIPADLEGADVRLSQPVV